MTHILDSILCVQELSVSDWQLHVSYKSQREITHLYFSRAVIRNKTRFVNCNSTSKSHSMTLNCSLSQGHRVGNRLITFDRWIPRFKLVLSELGHWKFSILRLWLEESWEEVSAMYPFIVNLLCHDIFLSKTLTSCRIWLFPTWEWFIIPSITQNCSRRHPIALLFLCENKALCFIRIVCA